MMMCCHCSARTSHMQVSRKKGLYQPEILWSSLFFLSWSYSPSLPTDSGEAEWRRVPLQVTDLHPPFVTPTEEMLQKLLGKVTATLQSWSCPLAKHQLHLCKLLQWPTLPHTTSLCPCWLIMFWKWYQVAKERLIMGRQERYHGIVGRGNQSARISIASDWALSIYPTVHGPAANQKDHEIHAQNAEHFLECGSNHLGFSTRQLAVDAAVIDPQLMHHG